MKTKTEKLSGIIKQIFPNASYKVLIDGTKESFCLCYLSGKITKRFSKPEIGDKVKFEIAPPDLTKGRIIYIVK